MKMYIDGRLVESGITKEISCPGDGSVAGTIAWAGATETQAALVAAERSLARWAGLPASTRAEWMRKLRHAIIDDETTLRDLVHLETGKPLAETQEDFESLVDSLEYYADQIEQLVAPDLPDASGTHRHRLQYDAVGVVGAFIAWNFPLLNLGFKLGPAMAAGCPIIIKPSDKTPLAAYRVGELCAQVGLPAGVVNILTGPDDIVGDGISSSTIPAMLTVIGSTATGRKVMASGATSIKRYSMELGGNAPAIIFADADLESAVSVIAALKFGNAGQTCVAPNRVYVHSDIAQEFTRRLAERASDTRLGFADDDTVTMGPVIDDRARERVRALIDDATAKGATVQTGGSVAPDGELAGTFVLPTVVTGVTPGMRLHDEEVFGPVASVIEFRDEADVVREANSTDAGLASYIFTTDEDRAARVADLLKFGEVQINGVKYAIDLPHLGIKQSGIGCDCSPLALHEYLSLKRVSEVAPR